MSVDWHDICTECGVMVGNLSKLEEINVLASEADWGWPAALGAIFRPRGVNLLVAQSTADFLTVIANTRIHTAIIDMDSERSSGLATIRVLRMDYPWLPCIMLTSRVDEAVLGDALRLNVFSVIDKPVEMGVLREQLNRLFIKRYNSTVFS